MESLDIVGSVVGGDVVKDGGCGGVVADSSVVTDS